ncbi:MAG: hypothetical protein MZV65_39955, partial [Chromatiales bacterium]|nr:hypothetical protein [Chromatiales bacterium]
MRHSSRAQGRERVETLVRRFAGVWRNRLHREEAICTALAALHLYRRDRHYLVRDGKVLIIDDTTGRVAPGRAWSRGLHQLIELKEGCSPTAPQVTAAQITYQRFFPRYLRLGGLSGTLCESAGELRALYDLGVQRVPLRRPDRRMTLPARLFPDRGALWEAVAQRVVELNRTRPAGSGGHRLGRRFRGAVAAPERAGPRARRPQCAQRPRRGRRSWPAPVSAAPSRWPPTWPAAAPTSRSAAAWRISAACTSCAASSTPRGASTASWRGAARARAIPAASRPGSRPTRRCSG